MKWLLAFLLLSSTADAEDFQAVWQRALERHQAGDFPAAITAYKECLRLEPGRYDARSNLGAVLAASGLFADAVEQYKQALTAAPAQYAAPLRKNLALAFYKSGQYSKVVETLAADGASGDLNTQLLLADSYLQN